MLRRWSKCFEKLKILNPQLQILDMCATMQRAGAIHKKKEYKQRRKPRKSDFQTLYRFNAENMEWMTQHFLGDKQETHGGAVSPKAQMMVFLWSDMWSRFSGWGERGPRITPVHSEQNYHQGILNFVHLQ